MIDGTRLLARLRDWSQETGDRPLGAVEVLALVLASALLLLIGPYSFYSPAGYLDPWIPTGYFLDLEDLILRFHYTYHVSRLPYLVPGLAAYAVFAPLVANFVLNLFFLSLAVISFYAIVARWMPRALAAAMTMAFALNPCTAAAFAWDYPDGPAIAYTLAAIAIHQAPSAIPEWRRLFYAGALFLMAGSSNLIAGLVIAPAALWLWLAGPFRPWALLKRGLALFGGVLAGFVLFGAVSKVVIGTSRFLGLQMDQFRLATRTEGLLANMWGTGSQWIADAPRLWTLLGLLAVGALVLAANRSARADRVLVRAFLYYAACAAAFLWVEFAMHAVVLRVFYHSSYLVVPAFLFFAALVAWIFRQHPAARWARPAPMGMLILGISWAVPAAYGLLKPVGGHGAAVWGTTLALALVALWGLLARRAAAVSASCLIASTAVASGLDRSMSYVFDDNRPTFEAAIEVSKVLRSGLAQGKILRFWFDPEEPLESAFHSINSLYLWGWRDLTRELAMEGTGSATHRPARGMPKLRMIDETEKKRLFSEGTLIVHLTSEPAKVERRRDALLARGVPTAWRGEWPIRVQGMSFQVILTEVTALGGPMPGRGGRS
jgi:hypothetical protein